MVALTAATDTKTLMKHTVKELQAQLRKHALETVGTKAVLVQRLQTHLRAAEAEESSPSAPVDAASSATVAAPSDAPVATERSTSEAVATADAADRDAADDVAAEGDAATSADSPRASTEAKMTDERPDDASARPASPAAPGKASTAADDTQADAHRAASAEDDASAATSDAPEQLSELEPSITTLRIDNFRRPFTLNAVKSLVQELGDFVEDNGFWMNTIKTHCYVSYASKDVATKTRERLDGKVWPPVSGIALSAAFSETTAMDVHAHGEPTSAGLKRKANGDLAPPSQRRREQPPVSIDATFLKTETKPVLYYLPWTDEQVKQRKEQQARGQAPRDANAHDIESSQRARGHRRGGKRKKRSARGGYRHVRRL